MSSENNQEEVRAEKTTTAATVLSALQNPNQTAPTDDVAAAEAQERLRKQRDLDKQRVESEKAAAEEVLLKKHLEQDEKARQDALVGQPAEAKEKDDTSAADRLKGGDVKSDAAALEQKTVDANRLREELQKTLRTGTPSAAQQPASDSPKERVDLSYLAYTNFGNNPYASIVHNGSPTKRSPEKSSEQTGLTTGRPRRKCCTLL